MIESSRVCDFAAPRSGAGPAFRQRQRQRQRPGWRSLLLALLALQLICDIRQQEKQAKQQHLSSFLPSVGQAAAQQQVNSGAPAAAPSLSDEAELQLLGPIGEGQVRFLVEPKDTWALLGQRQVKFQCATASRPGAQVRPGWSRRRMLLASEGRSINPHRFSVDLASWSPGELLASSSWNVSTGSTDDELSNEIQRFAAAQLHNANGNANNNQQDQQELLLTGYSLLIHNITLDDEDNYLCTAMGRTSRQARLMVAKPAARIEISVRQQPADSATSPLPADRQYQSALDADASAPTPEHQVATLGTNGEPMKIVAKQNSRIHLQCQAHEARPRAELTWFDQRHRPINKTGPIERALAQPAASLSPMPSDEDSLEDFDALENFAQVENSSPKLERSGLIYSFKVKREHHNQVFTCQARHKAFELMDRLGANEGELYREAPRARSVQLEVHYEPVIELTKDNLHPQEGDSLVLSCEAHARPNVLEYEWALDGQPIEGATGQPRLHIGRLSRRLHLREFKCTVRNPVGQSSATIRLSIGYAPAYATHLLPASLQPTTISKASGGAASAPASSASGAPTGAEFYADDEQDSDPLARQLAVTATEGDDVSLRCDFDSNPRLERVDWFRLASDWLLLDEVEPELAERFIEGGAMQACLGQRHQQQAGAREQGKRHIGDQAPSSSRQRTQAREHELLRLRQPEQLVNYGPMSELLLDELERAEEQQRQQANQSGARSARLFDELRPEPNVVTPVRLLEPLQFRAEKRRPSQRRSFASAAPDAPSWDADEAGGAPPEAAELVLVDEPDKTQLLWRSAQLTSSTLRLRRVNEDSVGKYVCVAQAADRARFARAVQLVLRQPPRIVSARNQFQSLASDRLQVECLVQLNGLPGGSAPSANQSTSILWFRSEAGNPNGDKPIDFNAQAQWTSSGDSQQQQQQPRAPRKKYQLGQQTSPDLLFVRSILYIHGAQPADFGQYNCTVINALGSDSIRINLQPTASTGLVFNLLLLNTLGLVVMLVVVCCLFVHFVLPCWRLDRNAMAKSAAAAVLSGKASSAAKPAPASRDADSASSSGNASGCEEKLVADKPAHGQQQQPARGFENRSMSLEATLDGSRLLVASVRQVGAGHALQMSAPLHRPQRPESAFSLPHRSTSAGAGTKPEQQMRCSLRFHAEPNRSASNRFAAIHESLENKLQFGPAERASKPADLTPPGGLLSRFWGKFSARDDEPADGGDAGGNSRKGRRHSGEARQRPTISMPSDFRSPGRSLSTSSASVSTLNEAQQQQRHLNPQLRHQLQLREQHTEPGGPGSGQAATGLLKPMMEVAGGGARPASSASSTSCHLASSAHLAADFCGYTSSAVAPVGTQEGLYNWPVGATTEPLQQQLQVVYSSGHAAEVSPSLSHEAQQQQQRQQQIYANYCATMASGRQQKAWAPELDNRNNATAEQYQLPALMSEQYLAQMADAVAAQQQQLQQQLYAPSKLATVLVPTNDGGDAYFESNYGTLLSKSSAYKTLGYSATSQRHSAGGHALHERHRHHHHQHQLGSGGTSATSPTSSSSSAAASPRVHSSPGSSPPSSLTTHAPLQRQPVPPPPPQPLSSHLQQLARNCPPHQESEISPTPFVDENSATVSANSSVGISTTVNLSHPSLAGAQATGGGGADDYHYPIFHFQNGTTMTTTASPPEPDNLRATSGLNETNEAAVTELAEHHQRIEAAQTVAVGEVKSIMKPSGQIYYATSDTEPQLAQSDTNQRDFATHV